MVGYLTPLEAKDRFFIKGEMKRNVITVNVPEGGGNISFDGRKYKSKIKPVIQGNKIKFIVSLSGKGTIRENNTNLDLKIAKNITLIENALKKQISKEISHTISHVQKDFGLDVFGFGQVVHRKYPIEWRTLKKNWNEHFTNAKFTVKADITVEDVGATGPSLQLKESGIKK
jgi:spore germination protein KC